MLEIYPENFDPAFMEKIVEPKWVETPPTEGVAVPIVESPTKEVVVLPTVTILPSEEEKPKPIPKRVLKPDEY